MVVPVFPTWKGETPSTVKAISPTVTLTSKPASWFVATRTETEVTPLKVSTEVRITSPFSWVN